MTAAEIIRTARRRAGISQALLAERTGIAKSQIGRWELGSVEPSYASVLLLVRACGLDITVTDPSPNTSTSP